MNSRERFSAACRREPVDHHPVWLMRQAGRYLPEYRDIREKYDFLTMCRRSDLIREISLQPWRRFGMDAVILFSDILLPMNSMGPKLTFEQNTGPRFDSTVTTDKDVKDLSIPNVRISFSYMFGAIEDLRHELGEETALLGFIGAPWTLAAYMIEGGGGSFETAVRLLREAPSTVANLMEKIAQVVAPLASEQVRAGCDAIQIFDTWGGLLSPSEYRERILPTLKKVVAAVHNSGAPAVLFIKSSGALIEEMIASGADAISIGPDIDIGAAFEIVGSRVAVQGNLDPEILLRGSGTVELETQKLLDRVGNRTGYIANLGHGILPETPHANVKAFVDAVKRFEILRP